MFPNNATRVVASSTLPSILLPRITDPLPSLSFQLNSLPLATSSTILSFSPTTATSAPSFSEWKRKIKGSTSATLTTCNNSLTVACQSVPYCRMNSSGLVGEAKKSAKSTGYPCEVVNESAQGPISTNHDYSPLTSSTFYLPQNSSGVNQLPFLPYKSSEELKKLMLPFSISDYRNTQSDFSYDSFGHYDNLLLPPTTSTSRSSTFAVSTSSYLQHQQCLPSSTTANSTQQPAKRSSNLSQQNSCNHGQLPTTVVVKNICKKTTSRQRKNVWKNQTYADLICKAILSSTAKKLTLSQIYDWLIENVEYFKSKKEGKNSVGWKNSIRHNLSLHSRFVRIQGHESGKSSWWTVDLNAKSSRRCKRKALDNSIKGVARGIVGTSVPFSTHLPGLSRYQSPSYPSGYTFDSYYHASSFYSSGYEGSLNGYVVKNNIPAINSKSVAFFDKKDKSVYDIIPHCTLSPNCFYYPDSYSCCYSSPFTPTTLVSTSGSSGSENNTCYGSYDNYYNYVKGKGGDTTNSSHYLGHNATDHYGSDYFYLRGSGGFSSLSDSTASGGSSSNQSIIAGGKPLPNLLSAAYTSPDYIKENSLDLYTQRHSDNGLPTSNYSNYSYYSRQDHSSSNGDIFSDYSLKKVFSPTYFSNVKSEVNERNRTGDHILPSYSI